jgi:PAS domain S-box-containing protein
VQDQNQSYLVHSLGTSFYAKQRLNLFCIVDLSSNPIHTRYVTSTDGPDSPLPDDLRLQLAKDGSLFQSALQLKSTGGIIVLRDGLLLLAASPILTTESQGPVRGMLLIGRFLHHEEVKRIGERANFTIGLLPFDGNEKNNSNAAIVVQQHGRDIIRGYHLLRDIAGKPAGLLYLEKTRQAYLEARKGILYLSAFSAVLFSAAAVLLYRISNKLTLVSVREYVSNLQIKDLFELSADGILRLDRQGLITEANLQACALTGYRYSELIGKELDQLFSGDEAEQQPVDYNRLQAGLVVNLQRELLRNGESTTPVDVRLKILPGGDCQCVLRDRTEQHHWEHMLHQQQELLNGIINGTGDIIYAKDLDGHYILVNDAVLRLAGKHRSEILGLNDSCVFPPETAAVFIKADQSVLDLDAVVLSEDTIPYPKQSETIYLSTRAPLRNKQGEKIGLFAILHDITARTMLEKELLSQHNRLGQLAISLSLAEEKERVRIAEELHDQVGPTLLSGKMKLNMLQARLTDSAMVDECEAIESLIKQAVQDIRSLTMQLRPPILANAGLEAALKWLTQEYAQKYGSQIRFFDDGQSKPLLYEKRTILFQAARELLLNVVKHAHCSEAYLAVQRSGTELRMTVTDNGVGFTANEAEAVGQGTAGFGLFNVTQKLSHIHGRLNIDALAVAGTRIVVTVPLDL